MRSLVSEVIVVQSFAFSWQEFTKIIKRLIICVREYVPSQRNVYKLQKLPLLKKGDISQEAGYQLLRHHFAKDHCEWANDKWRPVLFSDKGGRGQMYRRLAENVTEYYIGIVVKEGFYIVWVGIFMDTTIALHRRRSKEPPLHR